MRDPGGRWGVKALRWVSAERWFPLVLRETLRVLTR